MKPALKYCKIPIRFTAIEEDGIHLMIEASINRKKANLLVDTGASKTVFDITRIRNFMKGEETDFERSPHLSTGLGSSSIESHSTSIKLFRIGEVKLRNYPCVLLDLNHVNKSYKMLGIPPIDGVLGSDLLNQLHAQINFLSQSLKIYCVK